MRKRMPSFYAKNAAVHAQRRVLKEKKTESKKVDENREEAAKVICMCLMAALNEKYGVGETRLNRVVESANRRVNKFETTKQIRGADAAKQELREEVKGLLPGGFLLPLFRCPKNEREQILAYERRDAAEMTVEIYAKAMHEALGFGADRIAEVADETKTNYLQFRDYAEDDDVCGYVLLAREMGRILHTEVDVEEEPEKGNIFSKGT